MSDEELQSSRFVDDYCRDGAVLLVLSFLILLFSLCVLLGISIWLIVDKPQPVQFKTDNEWRVLPPVPINEPYISTPNLIQWVSDTLPSLFTLDFVNYAAQMNVAATAFVGDGWTKFQRALQNYAAPAVVQNGKLFVTATAGGAPFVTNQGMIQGSYGWWIQMPLNLSYSSANKGATRSLIVKVMVVRVPTLDDLKGIKIEDIIVSEGELNGTNE